MANAQLTREEVLIISMQDADALTAEIVRKCMETDVVWVQDDYLCMRAISNDPKTVAFLNRVAELKEQVKSAPEIIYAVKVVFKNNNTTSREYTYKSRFPVRNGDKVLVPTSNWYSVGEVTKWSSKHVFDDSIEYKFLISILDI